MKFDFLSNIARYIFIEYLDRTSFVISIFAIYIGYWFWKNPIETEMVIKRSFQDDENNIYYYIGLNHRGWLVRRVFIDNFVTSSEISGSLKEYANEKNNPGVKKAPNTIEELIKLNYSE